MLTKKNVAMLMLSVGISLSSNGVYAAEGDVTLNFRDAELLAVLEMYSKLTGKVFVPSEQVTGKVTIITPKPISRQQAVNMLFSVLDMRGYAISEVDNYYKVVPKANAMQAAGSGLRLGMAGDRIITEVLKPKHIPATALLESARAMVSQEAKLVADQSLNFLVVTDTVNNVTKLKELLADLDKVTVAPVTRSYQLQYAKVDSLAPLIDALLQGKSGASTAPSSAALNAGSPTAASAQPAAFGTGSTTSPQFGSTTGSTTSSAQNGAVLQDVRSNTLIVTASEYLHKQVGDVIKSLDIRSAQVLLEATIVEVTLTQTTKLGVQWQYFLNQLGPNAALGLSDGSDANKAFGNNIGNLLQAVRVLPPAQGLSFALLKPGEYAALLNLVATDTGARILSSPHLVASNNQEAALRIGNEVPLLKEFRLDQNNNPIRTFEREKVGLEIKLVPSIAQNRDISLKLFLKISSILGGTVNTEINQFSIAGREVATDVVVNDQQTLVISGLIRDDANESSNGVPLLRKVPLIGKLFGQKSDSGEKNELLIFIRPHIIATDGEADKASNEQLSKHTAAVDAAGLTIDMLEFDL
jgi:general secretion pathway protein D